MTPNVRTVSEKDDVMSLVDLMGILAHSDERIRDDVCTALRELSAETAATQVTVHDGIVELSGDADERAARIAGVIARTVPGVVRVVHGE